MAINPILLNQFKETTKNAIRLMNNYLMTRPNGYNYLIRPTAAIEAIAEYGAENIFMINSSYHGHYDDDDANFIYWNNKTGEFFDDNWTTRGACPSYSLYECTPVKVALEADILDKEKMLVTLKDNARKALVNINPIIEMPGIAKHGLKVTVKGGRKWKGTGILIGLFETSYQWGAPRYRSRYYRSSGYGTTTTEHAKIYDPKTNTINIVNSKYVVLEGIDEMKKAYKEDLKNGIETSTVNDIVFGTWMPQLKNMEVSINDWIIKNFSQTEDLKKAHELEKKMEEEKEAIKKAKHEEFKKSKMPELIEWVKNNTDKKGDAIERLAEHIFNKRYSY